jgi:hypothetical protein
MIASLREAFNLQFSEAEYERFLSDLDKAHNHHITFRVAETPVFIGQEFKHKLLKASDSIIDFIVRDDFKHITEKAIPDNLRVPNEDGHTLFLALDFAVVRDEHGELQPRLIEMQGFPSLYCFQDFIANQFRQHFPVPETMQSHFGLSSEAYQQLIKRLLLNGHAPEEVVLLEIDPLKQNTAIDFVITQAYTGIEPVHIGDVKRENRKLFYHKDGKKIHIKRIYNRVIFDELIRRTDLMLEFNLTEDVDVEWAGHPNWFFRISKYTMPFIKSEYVPECKFLSDYSTFPEDLENYVLKPLFSFSGSGVIFNLQPEDLHAIPETDRHNFMLQRKVAYEPIIQAPDGLVKTEIRLLFLWENGKDRPHLVTNLVRLSRGELIGVKFNKNKTWVGGTVGFFET